MKRFRRRNKQDIYKFLDEKERERERLRERERKRERDRRTDRQTDKVEEDERRRKIRIR